MKFNRSNINKFLFLKLPSAYLTGVRLEEISDRHAVVRVRHRWINQNPFRSLYFGVMAMAAEISTGVLLLREIQQNNTPVSMLVIRQRAEFIKKAKGVIRFVCDESPRITAAVRKALESGEPQVITLHATGRDESSDTVAEFEFDWSIKKK